VSQRHRLERHPLEPQLHVLPPVSWRSATFGLFLRIQTWHRVRFRRARHDAAARSGAREDETTDDNDNNSRSLT
jgi:hypothetical protein